MHDKEVAVEADAAFEVIGPRPNTMYAPKEEAIILTPKPVTAKWSDPGLSGKMRVRDLWQQRDLGTFDGRFETEAPRHGVGLVRLFPAKAQ